MLEMLEIISRNAKRGCASVWWEYGGVDNIPEDRRKILSGVDVGRLP